VLLGNNRLTLTSADSTYAGTISGTGSLELAAGSSLTLTGGNTYTGLTTIASGATLRVGDGGTGGTLPGTLFCPGIVTCYGTGLVTNDGTLVFDRSDASTFLGRVSGTGSMRVEAGSLRVDGVSQSSTYIAPGAGLSVTYLAGSVTNNGTLAFVPPIDRTRFGESVSSITGQGAMRITGWDRLTLSGPIALAGGLTIENSAVAMTGGNSFLGGISISRGSLSIGMSGSGEGLTGNVALNGSTIAFDTPSAGRFAGNISGTGQLQVVGAGRLTLTGNAGFSGTTTIGVYPIEFSILPMVINFPVRPTLLEIGDGGTTGSVAGNIVNYGILAFNRSDAATYDGVISGRGRVAQIGTGTLTLSGTNTYTGVTTVEAGTLSVTGSIAASQGVLVLSGATLTGGGTLPSVAVQSGGTFAPGNSVGTATVLGSLALAPGSTAAIEVRSAAADRINVTGTASLGGTLRLIPLGGGYAFNAPYTLISADGGRSGTFATVSTQGSFGAGVTNEVTYTANAVNLTLMPAQLVPEGLGSTPMAPGLVGVLPGNLRQTALALDAARAAGGNLQPFFNVYNAPANQIGNAVNQLSGEVGTSSTAMGLVAGQQFLGSMLNASGLGGDTRTGSRIAAKGSGDGDDMGAPPRPRYAMWGQATGAYSRVSSESGAGSATRSARGAGFAMGLDIALGAQSVIGVAAAAGETSASLSGGLGRANAWTGQLGVFGRTRLDTRAGGFTLEGAAAVSFLETDTKRTQYFLNNAEQRASYDARVYSFRLEGRHDGIRRPGIAVEPLMALQAQVVDSDGYSETSLAPGTPTGVSARSATNSTVRTELGVRAEGFVPAGTRVVRGFARVAWGHYLMRDQNSAVALQAFPGNGFTVQGARPDTDSAILTAGLEMEIAPRWTLGARVDSELSSRVREVAGTVRLRYAL
jgi:autotransporter-associated beta strand protein